MTQLPLQLDVVSDVMCPWCYIGKRRLEKAVELADVTLDLRWRPYQLDPTLPAEGKPRAAYLAEKFGSLERAGERYAAIRAAGAAEDIPFAFERIAMSPNTLDAHRLIRWAANAGPEVQDRVVEALFRGYFVEGRDIGAHPVLVEIAAEAGMDAALVAELLAGEADRELVRREVDLAREMGVTGVPTFIIANRYAVIGAQAPHQLAEAFQLAFAQEGADGNAAAG
ncbi:MAG TPA: DsbA family oxidoreductase [Afifellaceae bacterium]|nr:DsbA family oxidoreductase [Afifellaceae bacterium]